MPRYIDIEPFADCRIVANKEDTREDISISEGKWEMRCETCLHFEACRFIMERYTDDTLNEDGAACSSYMQKKIDRLQDSYANGVLCNDLPVEDDVVKVVRCKNCRFREDLVTSGIYCRNPDNRNPLGCRPDDFCSDGMEGPEMTEAELLEWIAKTEEEFKGD